MPTENYTHVINNGNLVLFVYGDASIEGSSEYLKELARNIREKVNLIIVDKDSSVVPTKSAFQEFIQTIKDLNMFNNKIAIVAESTMKYNVGKFFLRKNRVSDYELKVHKKIENAIEWITI